MKHLRFLATAWPLLFTMLTLPGGAQAEDVKASVGWAQRVELGPLVSGVVREVHVRAGSTVAAGDALVGLDDRAFRSELARAIAADRHARAVLEEAQREDDRAAELYDRTVLSDFERNQARIALRGAQAAAAQARSALVTARLNVEYATLRAPFDGIVLRLDAVPGQSVISELQSTPLVAVADHRRYQLRAQVDAVQATRLAPGAELRATVGGQAGTAKVLSVGLEPVKRSARTASTVDAPRYELVAEIVPAGGQVLRVGTTATLVVE